MSDRPDNAFLRALSPDAYAALAEHLAPIRPAHGEELHAPGQPVEWVYFPVSAVLSVLTQTQDGQSVETAMAGNEGALGVLEVLGSGVSTAMSLAQIDGLVMRAPAAAFRRIAPERPEVVALSFRLIEAQLAESRQSGLCQALHTVEPRFARWLLETMERCGGRTVLPLTQEFLAAMLGVQRTTVNAFASQLQKAGLINSRRGRIEIVDPAGLEHRACECRRDMRDQRRRLGLEPLRVSDTRLAGE